MEVGYTHFIVILVVKNVVKCVVDAVELWCFAWLKLQRKNGTVF
jgi:hypothetical protein